MPDYNMGLKETWVVLLVIASIIALIGVSGLLRVYNELSLTKRIAFAALAIFVAPAIVSLCFFPLIYCSFNLISQPLLSASFWKAELATGVFAIRVSSYLITYQFLRSLARLAGQKLELLKTRQKRGLNYDDSANFTIDRRPEEAGLWFGSDIAFAAVAQFLFYLSVIAALWLNAIDGAHSLALALASWALFFIIDDWVIISEYTDELQVPPIPTHLYKVIGFDIALILLVPVAMFSASVQLIFFILTFAMLFFATVFFMYTWRLRYVTTKP